MKTNGSLSLPFAGIDITAAFSNKLATGPYRAFDGGMGVELDRCLPSRENVVHPKVSISAEKGEGDRLQAPIALIEIESPGNDSYTDKAASYRQMLSLRHLVFVKLHRIAVEHQFRCQADEEFRISDLVGWDAVLDLTMIGIAIPLSEIYHGVALNQIGLWRG